MTIPLVPVTAKDYLLKLNQKLDEPLARYSLLDSYYASIFHGGTARRVIWAE